MQPIADEFPHMSDAGLALCLGDRVYGDDRPADHIESLRRMPIPPQMDPLLVAIEQQSALLALPADVAAERIYDAFGKDLQLLVQYRDAFKETFDAAVRARADAGDAEAQAFLGRVTAQISEVVFEPTLDLGPKALRLDAAALRRRLQEQFRADVTTLVGSLAVWLHIMAESHFVSVIEWLNPRAVRYHFFRMETRRRELSRDRSVTGDIFTGRTIKTTTSTQVDLFTERRVHTVVNAAAQPLGDYEERVPQRIARLIDAVPAEVRPFLSIIDGTVSQEEVHRRVADSRVETTTHAVFIPDPALALFDTWAINGWGGSTQEKANALYRDHPLVPVNRFLFAEIIAAVLLSGAGMIEGGPVGGLLIAALCAVLIWFHQSGAQPPAEVG